MAINRAPFNALVDDDGSNTIGTPWNKAAIAGVILDPVDAALAAAPVMVLGNGEATAIGPVGVTNAYVIPITGLTRFDTVLIEGEFQIAGPVNLPRIELFYATGPVSLVRLDLVAAPLSAFTMTRTLLRALPPSSANNGLFIQTTGTGPGAQGVIGTPLGIPSWTGSWNLIMQHDPIAAGTTLYWKISVTRIARPG